MSKNRVRYLMLTRPYFWIDQPRNCTIGANDETAALDSGRADGLGRRGRDLDSGMVKNRFRGIVRDRVSDLPKVTGWHSLGFCVELRGLGPGTRKHDPGSSESGLGSTLLFKAGHLLLQ